ncbi:helix-turn-helix domain-containing protein [Nocardia flavorosea]|uniref:helix-turn-helix domain-containing protein n=1 Tax=Nocardia flavorosea TaxID=53429 RepID=UPI002455414D|nr:helix-turn-helix domain-containing protein [Nocardia flavorosea]
MPAKLLDIETAAEELGISRSLVYKLMNSGQLRSIKVGVRRMIPATAVDEFIAERLAA